LIGAAPSARAEPLGEQRDRALVLPRRRDELERAWGAFWLDCLLGVRRVGERRKIDDECGERQANAAFH
jgi:hypothetical protein